MRRWVGYVEGSQWDGMEEDKNSQFKACLEQP